MSADGLKALDDYFAWRRSDSRHDSVAADGRGELLPLQRPLTVLAQPAGLPTKRLALCSSPRNCQSSQLTATDAAAPPFGSKYVPPWPTGRFATATGTCEIRRNRPCRSRTRCLSVRRGCRSSACAASSAHPSDVHAGIALEPLLNTPVFCSTIVFTRGSFATWSACRPPQLQPGERDERGVDAAEVRAVATGIFGERPVDRVGQIRRFVRGGWISPLARLSRGTRLARRGAGAAQDAAAARSRDNRATRSRAGGAWCSRRRRNIRRCPRPPRPVSARQARRGLSAVD